MSKQTSPECCVDCGAGRQVHAGHGNQFRRNGWLHYDCGRRWHPDVGWDSPHVAGCLARRLAVAQRAIHLAEVRAKDLMAGNRRLQKRVAEAVEFVSMAGYASGDKQAPACMECHDACGFHKDDCRLASWLKEAEADEAAKGPEAAP